MKQMKEERKERELVLADLKLLSHPLPNKDMDSTLPFKDDFSIEECETDTGQFSFQVNMQGFQRK